MKVFSRSSESPGASRAFRLKTDCNEGHMTGERENAVAKTS